MSTCCFPALLLMPIVIIVILSIGYQPELIFVQLRLILYNQDNINIPITVGVVIIYVTLRSQTLLLIHKTFCIKFIFYIRNLQHNNKTYSTLWLLDMITGVAFVFWKALKRVLRKIVELCIKNKVLEKTQLKIVANLQWVFRLRQLGYVKKKKVQRKPKAIPKINTKGKRSISRSHSRGNYSVKKDIKPIKIS